MNFRREKFLSHKLSYRRYLLTAPQRGGSAMRVRAAFLTHFFLFQA